MKQFETSFFLSPYIKYLHLHLLQNNKFEMMKRLLIFFVLLWGGMTMSQATEVSIPVIFYKKTVSKKDNTPRPTKIPSKGKFLFEVFYEEANYLHFISSENQVYEYILEDEQNHVILCGFADLSQIKDCKIEIGELPIGVYNLFVKVGGSSYLGTFCIS